MALLACQVLAAFSPAARASSSRCSSASTTSDDLQVVALGHQLVLCELQCVGPRYQRKESALVSQVVHDQHFAVVIG